MVSTEIIAHSVTPDALLDLFSAYGYDTITTHHPPLFTVADGAAWHDKIPGQHCKNLFVTEHKTGQAILLCCLATSRPDLNRLMRQIGFGRASFASEETLWDILGVRPGSVTPFALVNDRQHKCQVVLEKAMIEAGYVNFHPLTNDRSTSLTTEDLIDFIERCGFVPRIEPFPQRP